MILLQAWSITPSNDQSKDYPKACLFDSFSSGYPQARDGKVRALGVSSPDRSPLVPELPAITEQLPGFVSMTWFGVFGPAGMPQSVVNKLNASFNKVLKDPQLKEQLAKMGIDGIGGTPADFSKKLSADTQEWQKVITDAKITLQSNWFLNFQRAGYDHIDDSK